MVLQCKATTSPKTQSAPQKESTNAVAATNAAKSSLSLFGARHYKQFAVPAPDIRLRWPGSKLGVARRAKVDATLVLVLLAHRKLKCLD